jgi:hypothetical protein
VGGEDSDQNDSVMTERLMKYNAEGKRKAGWIYFVNDIRHVVTIGGGRLSTEMDGQESYKTPKPPQVMV